VIGGAILSCWGACTLDFRDKDYIFAFWALTFFACVDFRGAYFLTAIFAVELNHKISPLPKLFVSYKKARLD